MKPVAPCLDCPDRKPCCHSTCEKYLKFRYELDKIKQEELKEKILDQEIRRVKNYTLRRRNNK